MLAWRRLFLAEIEKIAARYPPRDAVDLETLADMISTTIEGGIIMAKALRDPPALAAPDPDAALLHKLLFAPA